MEKKLTGYPSIDKPWLKYYSEEAINAPLPECTIYEYLMENNRNYVDDIAILYLGRKIKYGELFHQIDRTAAAFSELGVKPGDIVTVALPSIPEALYVVYALNKIGAVSNMIHPLAGEKEILNYLNEVQSEVAILFEGTYNIIKDRIGQTSVRQAVVISAGESLPFVVRQFFFLRSPRARLPKSSVFQTWRAFLARGKGILLPDTKKDSHKLALISHTGGTTGEPKGVMLSDYNINSVIWQISRELEYDRQEINMAVLPPFVNYSLVDGMLAPLAFGFQLVLIPAYKSDQFDLYYKKYKPNHLMASIPAYYEPLLHNDKLKEMDLSCLKHLYYGGDKMSAEMEQEINRFLKAHGAQFPLAKGLGSTEMVSAATVTYDEINLMDSSGIPLVKITCKIVDPETNGELSYDAQGEICMTGPSLMLGYYNKPEATADVIKIHSDGMRWFHTGDMGYITEQGALFVTGRIKRIVMTKGLDGNVTKMFPDRIEKVIYKHPAVELCCVIGIPDEKRINYPKAFVVLKKEELNKNRITEEILQICREELPNYMVPDGIEYRSELPRTPRGKIDYRELEREIEA
ncbi:MAG: acyl--CoA ligase [Oscillospiraceae bacterium]|nr:acyl--CoA ligase [Oscillospiraceae bacterium]